MTLIENEEGTFTHMNGEDDPSLADLPKADQDEFGEEENADTKKISAEERTEDRDDIAEEADEKNERSEYERLIKGRFKEQFAADTQKMINRRFKKYKSIEEKLARLEAEAARYSDMEKLIADERSAAIKETEDRMTRQFKSNRMRAEENALSASSARPKFDVSRLTKSERAQLATRALRGEKIHLK